MTNCKTTLIELVTRNSNSQFVVLSSFLLNLVLCCSLAAQGTYFSEQPESGTTPDWFSNGYPKIHGLGIAHFSSFNPSAGYRKAFDRAVQDLNANLLTSVYLETFNVTANQPHRNYEFAIDAQIDSTSVSKTDSSTTEDYVYYLVTIDSVYDEIPFTYADISNRVANWNQEEYFNPVQVNGYWIAAGYHDYSRFNPYKSWAKAKLEALSNLSRHLSTGIQSMSKHLNTRLQEITYSYSKSVFQHIYILQRQRIDDTSYVLLAVSQDQIVQIDNPE